MECAPVATMAVKMTWLPGSSLRHRGGHSPLSKPLRLRVPPWLGLVDGGNTCHYQIRVYQHDELQ